MKTNLQKIGERIGDKRREKNFTYRMMAESLGISTALYKRIEAGERSVTVEQIQTLCVLLHISPDWLLNGQLGLLECLDIIENIQTTPEDFRGMAIKMPWIAKDAAMKVKCK